MIRKLALLYIAVMHSLATIYTYNVIGVGFSYTFLTISISSLILLLLAINAYVKSTIEAGLNRTRNYLYLFLIMILPITIVFYLPLFYSYFIIKLISIIFPSIALYLQWLSYNPTYILFSLPQFIISIFVSLFTYFYLGRIKKIK